MDLICQTLDHLCVGNFSYFRFHVEMACCYVRAADMARFTRLVRHVHLFKSPLRLRCLALAYFTRVCVFVHERDDVALREHLLGMFDSADAMDF
jgi:hypothetical protein